MSDDAEFDAFLKGEGDLSRLLKDMPQAEPSAALDAAILARARSAMEQEARPQAANDPGEPGVAPQLAPSMARRWRMPVGIAATMLAGLFAVKSLQPNLESQYGPIPETSVAEAPAAAAAPPMQAAPPAEAMADAQSEAKPAMQDKAKRTAVQERLRASAAKSERPRMVLEERSVLQKPAAPPPPPVPAPAPVQAEPPPPPPPAMAFPAPAPASVPIDLRKNYAEAERKAMAAGVAADAAREERVTVTRSRIAPRTQDKWIEEIGTLLREGRKEEALEQWKLFRAAHPHAKVDPALEAQLVQ